MEYVVGGVAAGKYELTCCGLGVATDEQNVHRVEENGCVYVIVVDE